MRFVKSGPGRIWGTTLERYTTSRYGTGRDTDYIDYTRAHRECSDNVFM